MFFLQNVMLKHSELRSHCDYREHPERWQTCFATPYWTHSHRESLFDQTKETANMGWTGRKPRRRARDGHLFLSSSQRRRRRKLSGSSARQQKKAIKSNRAYKNG